MRGPQLVKKNKKGKSRVVILRIQEKISVCTITNYYKNINGMELQGPFDERECEVIFRRNYFNRITLVPEEGASTLSTGSW